MSLMRRSLGVVTSLALVLTLSSSSSSQEFGSITFPTSGAAGAQDAFLTGVKALHNFQFDEAAVAFQAARKADPTFAMAYWGEAMSHNHPLWAQQDVDKAKAVLDLLDPTPAGRVAKAKLPKEKAFIEAQQTLYFSPGDKLARDNAYSQAMARMYSQWPDDDEVATFYALSLLGTVRPGDTGFRRQALAASIAESVYAKNPKHPGAAHFIIHAFDDPDHAPLGLNAARAYAKIAPSAAHALHMPSHIFVQLGMWQDAVDSNIAAYKAAVDLNTRMKLAEGREDFHTLSWLAYANVDDRQAGRGEEEHRAGEGGRGSQPDERRHPRRLSGHARALHLGHRPVGEALAGAGGARGWRSRQHARDARHGRRWRLGHLDLHRRRQRGEDGRHGDGRGRGDGAEGSHREGAGRADVVCGEAAPDSREGAGRDRPLGEGAEGRGPGVRQGSRRRREDAWRRRPDRPSRSSRRSSCTARC